MLALCPARKQHRGEIHHQHDYEDKARCAERDERGSNPRDDVGLQSSRIQLQAAAVEIPRIDDAPDGVNGGCHRARRCAATSADEPRVPALLRIRIREIYFEWDIRIYALWRRGRLV